MKNLICILLLAFSALTSCSKEDDIEEILCSHPWYVTNIYFTSTNQSAIDNSQVLYQSGSYYVEFQKGGQLTGKTNVANSDISGTWSADGNSRTLLISANGTVKASDAGASKLMLQVLNNAGSYEGDSNVLRIKTKNGQYYMTLGSIEK